MNAFYLFLWYYLNDQDFERGPNIVENFTITDEIMAIKKDMFQNVSSNFQSRLHTSNNFSYWSSYSEDVTELHPVIKMLRYFTF